jgi:hypothetical protein
VTTNDTDCANALTEVRRGFASGRTRALPWRVQQLRAIEQMYVTVRCCHGRLDLRSCAADSRHRIDRRRGRFHEQSTKTLGAVRLHQQPPIGARHHRPDAVRWCRHQPRDDALPGTATAVRRRRCQRNGRLPRPMGIRDTQPPPRGASQTVPAQPDADLPAARARAIIRRLL